MKKLTVLFLVLMIGSLLAACGSISNVVVSTKPTTAARSASSQSESTAAISTPAQQSKQAKPPNLNRTDSQGAVTVEVKPEDLNNPGPELVFDVSMNTHSVDLSMDLAALATLSTDNGKTVQADLWKGPGGGHHVSGKLTFPANVDGKPLLGGATKLVLTIKNVGAPERTFTWDLTF